MKPTLARAWLSGFGILIFAIGVWAVALQVGFFSETLFLVVSSFPAIAAFVAALLAPNKKVLLGSSMAIVWAMLSVALSVAFQVRGTPVDLPGFQGGVIQFLGTLAYSLVLCSVAAAAAGWLSTYLLRRGLPPRQGEQP